MTQSAKDLVGLRLCLCELVNNRMEGNTDLIVYIERDVSFYYDDEFNENIDGFKTSKYLEE